MAFPRINCLRLWTLQNKSPQYSLYPLPGTFLDQIRYNSRMTLCELNALNTEEKAAAAMAGNFVDVRIEKGLKVALYSHPDFYAEVFYDSESNRITNCRAFTSITPLAAYIHLTS